jgi:hypothetical protein
MPDYYTYIKKETDCESFINEKITNCRKRIYEIQKALKFNNTKEAFLGHQKINQDKLNCSNVKKAYCWGDHLNR